MRVKGGIVTRRRHKKILKRAKGYYAANGRCFIHATEKVDHGLQYAYRDRRTKKREMRQLWTQRINAAARLNGTTYSRLMGALRKANVTLDRKILADMAVHDLTGFSAVVSQFMPSQAHAS